MVPVPCRCCRAWRPARLLLAGLALVLMTSCGNEDRKIVSRYEKIAQEMTIEPLTPRGLPDGVRDGFCGYDEYFWVINVTIQHQRMVKIDIEQVGQEDYRAKVEPYIEKVLEAQSPVVEYPEDDLMIKGFLKAVEYALQAGGK